MRTPQRRLRQLWFDLRMIAKHHGIVVMVKYCIAKTIGRGAWLVRVRVLGSWMYLNLQDPGISYQLLVHGMREAGHVEQVQSAMTAGMRGLEIGANIGYYALLEGHLVGPSGHIYCIEPAPDNVSLLRKNITENRLDDRTSCFQYLVGEKNGFEKLFLSSAANSHSVSVISERFVQLPMVTIDYFLATEHINPAEIDFLRMDIEGYEAMVLQHMQTLLADRKKPLKLFIELHPDAYAQWGWSLVRLIDHLLGLGFTIRSVVKEARRSMGNLEMDQQVYDITSSAELVARFREWRQAGRQTGIWAFFELPAR